MQILMGTAYSLYRMMIYMLVVMRRSFSEIRLLFTAQVTRIKILAVHSTLTISVSQVSQVHIHESKNAFLLASWLSALAGSNIGI